MAKKKLLTTPYAHIPTEELKLMRKNLIQKANKLLKLHQYFEVQMIKEDVDLIDVQLKINREEAGVV